MKHMKALSAALAVCMLAGSCITPVTVQAREPDYNYGDANLDNSVDVADAVLVARYAASDASATITDLGKIQADVNLDENVDGSDLTMILEFIAKKRNYLGRQSDSEKSYNQYNLTKNLTANQVKDKTVDDSFAMSQYDLTAKLMKEISFSETSQDNILISPMSIAAALAMTANGAGGETRAELEKLLGGNLDMEALNQYYHNLFANLPSSEQAKLHLANSIWNSEERTIRNDYLQTVKDYYPNMDVFKAPFTDSTRTDINNWISDNTDGMITDMLKNMDPNAVTYLINALAFDAEWETAWKDSYKDTFSGYNGSKQDVTMMTGEEKYYISDEYAEGFVKQYAGGTYSFVGILPRESQYMTVSDYVGMMDGDSLKALLDSRVKTDVNVSMPKFKYDYATADEQLGNALQKLGVKQAFDPDKADFSKLYEAAENYPYIGRVLHNTFIDVNEQGTKAAAATIVEMTEKGAMGYRLNFSRPFLFMILDERTKLPVFIGSVRNPEYEAQPELKENEVRFTVRDGDTGELLTLDENRSINISTNISYNTPNGKVSSGPIIRLTQNPQIVSNFGQYFKADSFSMGVDEYALPSGCAVKDITTVERGNNAYDVTVKLVRIPQTQETDLAPNTIRYTVLDAETGKQVALNSSEHLSVLKKIRIYDPTQTDPWFYTFPATTLIQNGQTEKDTSNFLSADSYEMWLMSDQIPAGHTLSDYSMSFKRYSNNSCDVVIKLHQKGTAFNAAVSEMPELNQDDVRFTVVDADTGERIPGLDTCDFQLISKVGYKTNDGLKTSKIVTTLKANPYTIMQFGKHFDADQFALDIDAASLPAGYVIPDSQAIEYHEDQNGGIEVTVRLKRSNKEQLPLNADDVRFTVVDADTGAQIPLSSDNCLEVYAMVLINKPMNDDAPSTAVTINANPFTIRDYAQYIRGESIYDLEANPALLPAGYTLPDEPFSYSKHDNGSYDVTVRLKALPELNADEVRFTVLDRYSGEKIALDDRNYLLIMTDYAEPQENPVLGLPVDSIKQNPKTIKNFARYCDSSRYNLIVHNTTMPEGYEPPQDEMISKTKHTNGSYDITIRLSKQIMVP